MKADLKIERFDKKTGKLLQSFSQESRSFTEGIMHALYCAISRKTSTQFRSMGYAAQADDTFEFMHTRYYSGFVHQRTQYMPMKLGNMGGPSSQLRVDLTNSAGSAAVSIVRPTGIFFGEDGTAESSYDNTLHEPVGFKFPVPASVVQLDTATPNDTVVYFDGTNYWSLDDAANPNVLRKFDINGNLLASVNTNQITVGSSYYWCYVAGGYIYAYRANENLVKIDVVTGITALTRATAADLTGVAYAGGYDSADGTLFGITQNGEFIRWSLADFTVDTAAVIMDGIEDCYEGAFAPPYAASLFDAAGAYIIVGYRSVTAPKGFCIYDVVNNRISQTIYYSFGTTNELLTFRSGMNLHTDGWIYLSRYAATGHRIYRIRPDMRELNYGPIMFTLPDCDAVDGEFTFWGDLVNDSGGNVTLNEVGIHIAMGPVFPMISRDVLGAPVVLGDGEYIRATFTLSASI